jgi:hypothetical protein
MSPKGYELVVEADGCRRRWYFRWQEIPAAARLPEHLWPVRWGAEERCAVAVSNKRRGPQVRFHPCGMKRRAGSDLCALHARKERHPGYQHDAGGAE